MGKGRRLRLLAFVLLAGWLSTGCVWGTCGVYYVHRSSFGVTTYRGHLHSTTCGHAVPWGVTTVHVHSAGCGHAYVGGRWVRVR